jgi:hypothetical protein
MTPCAVFQTGCLALPTEDQSKPNQPVKAFSDGAIPVVVCRNDGEDGPRCSVTGCRRYKDKADECKETSSYGQDDLQALAQLVDVAPILHP